MKLLNTFNNFLIIAILLSIIIPTILTVKKRHEQALITVTENKIKETAKQCYLNKQCLENKILLLQLYEYNLLSPVIHPISKEYYNNQSYVLLSENKFIEVK